ncbi:putative uncharacterized protein DDB_G0287113, partial [Astatotilapia calliptera]|uniref:putative uncharacterized protein DDB_G0287113 n=1 Tax=Astatotilapia calliptera TaxID=8154 RepID=UPI000E422FB6
LIFLIITLVTIFLCPFVEHEGLDDQQVSDQERSLNQEDPEPPQIKEEQEETHSSEEGEQLELKQEDEGINVWTGEQLDLLCKPGLRLSRIDLPQQHDCKENEDLDDPQVCSQERNSSLDQQDTDPPQTKDEQEEISTNQEEEQLSLKQETNMNFPQQDCKDKNPLVLKQKTETFPAFPEESDHSDPEPSNEQLLSQNFIFIRFLEAQFLFSHMDKTNRVCLAA